MAPHWCSRTMWSSEVTWIGLAMIVVAALTLTLLSTYPGYLAVLPVAGTALVIAGGKAVPRWGAERLLGLPPMRALGRVENPVRHWRWLVDRPGTTLAAAAALVASCVVFTYAF